MRRLSASGAGAILGHEAIILEAYLDPVKVWTIGGGHTAAAGGLAPRAGLKVTLRQALDLFLADMDKFEAGVRRAVGELAQHEHDGFVSFHYNTGAVQSGTVDDRWRRGDRSGAMSVLRAYVNAKGKRLPGLVTRRAEEEAMIMRGEYPKRKILVKDTIKSQGRMMALDQLPWGAKPVEVELDVPLAEPAPTAAPAKPNFLLDLARYIGRAFSWT